MPALAATVLAPVRRDHVLRVYDAHGKLIATVNNIGAAWDRIARELAAYFELERQPVVPADGD